MNEHTRSLIKRVRDTIADPKQRAMASDVLQIAIIAIEQFSVLDETIYAYFADEGLSFPDHDELRVAMAEVMFTEVHGKTFRAVRKLCSYLRTKRLLGNMGKSTTATNDDFDFGEDFDLCFEDSTVRSLPKLQDLGLDEIDKAFEALADDIPDSSTMYTAFLEQVGTLGRLLVQEAEMFDRRISASIESHNFELALRELDGSRQSLGEGLFALVSAVFEVFGVHVERSDIVPSYKDALEQSLLLRQGLSVLSQVVACENDWVIKDASMSEADVAEAIGRVADEVESFVKGELCRAMRAPDRLELESFLRKLRNEPMASAALACEGLAKYLESLSIINQREVLVEHDKQVMNEMRQSLEAARSLLALSPGTAMQLVRESLQYGEKLRGRNAKLDEQLDQWSGDGTLLEEPEDTERVIDILDALLR